MRTVHDTHGSNGRGQRVLLLTQNEAKKLGNHKDVIKQEVYDKDGVIYWDAMQVWEAADLMEGLAGAIAMVYAEKYSSKPSHLPNAPPMLRRRIHSKKDFDRRGLGLTQKQWKHRTASKETS